MTDNRARRRGRWQIVAVAVLFIGPTIAAWMLVQSGWRPGAMTNNGELVDPPVRVQPTNWQRRDGARLASREFDGYWTLLAVVDGACNAPCVELLDALRRVRVALDKDVDRVRILLLQPRGAGGPARELPGLTMALAPRRQLDGLLEPAADGEAAMYVVDYRGFRMLRYPLPLDASGMLDDLERLLRLSNEDVEAYRQRGAGEAGA